MTLPVPTQVAHPANATVRTLFQVLIGLAAASPVLIADMGIDKTIPVVGAVLAVSALVTRVMAIPGVNLILGRIGLSAAPKQ